MDTSAVDSLLAQMRVMKAAAGLREPEPNRGCRSVPCTRQRFIACRARSYKCSLYPDSRQTKSAQRMRASWMTQARNQTCMFMTSL